MKNDRLAWKKYALTAAAAFVLGLLPYFILVVSTGSVGLTLPQYAAEIGALAWRTVSKYAPHILTAYIAGVALLIFLEGQNPDRTILWLVTLAFVPILGIVLYVLLGPDLKRLKNRKLFKPVKSYPTIVSPLEEKTPVRVKKSAVLAFRSSGADIMERGEVRILIDGEETFAQIKAALRGAKRYIHIEYFIFQNDRLGGEIAEILCEKARQGVKVRMTTDGVGSRISRKRIRQLLAAGVEYKTFMPVSFPAFHSGINFRNHRKIVVVDSDVAFTGGLNVGVEYLGEGRLGKWRDTHAQFTGEAVYALNDIFLQDWEIASGESLSPDHAQFAATEPEHCAALPFLPIQIVASGSASPWHSISDMYFLMIAEAQKRIWIATPYLVPGEAIMKALTIAALSGVDVRLLIPDKPDHFLVFWAGRSNIEMLLRAGVRIWFYTDGFIHAKTVLMDDTIASVGTANLDNRSLEINFEVQAFIYDAQMCAIFERDFLRDLDHSRECQLSEWEKRGAGFRVLESMGRLWSSQI